VETVQDTDIGYHWLLIEVMLCCNSHYDVFKIEIWTGGLSKML